MQAGRTLRSEQKPLSSGKPNLVSIAAAVGLAQQNVRPPEPVSFCFQNETFRPS